MSSAISEFVVRKFDTDIAKYLGLSGRQRISVIFKINKNYILEFYTKQSTLV